MRRGGLTILGAAVLLACSAPLHAKKPNLPRLPGSTLLVGWPPFRLTLTSGGNTLQIQNEPQSDWLVMPSLSADGTVVASAHPAAGAAPRSRNLIVSVWSLADRKWSDPAALAVAGGSVALSPDGTRVACVTRFQTDAPSRLEVLNRGSGKIVQGPEVFEDAGTDISWAPDSRRLVFDMGDNGSPVKGNPSPQRAIYVMNTDTGALHRIAQGVAPAWSPSGGWIAYLDYVPDNDDAGPGFAAPQPNRVALMRADGTEAHALVTWPRDEGLMLPPVWSPGSQAILINRWHDRQKETMDIDRIDLATAKITRTFRNVPPVYAWMSTTN